MATADIREYLQQWYACCPDVHKSFVQQVMVELGVANNPSEKHIANANLKSISTR
jgi:hypothetical protein